MSRRLHRRTHHRLAGHHIARQRLIALLMIASGLLRVMAWATLILLFLVGVPAIRHLYATVSFVSVLSVLALLLTDWGQVAASLAQLTAGDVHHDVAAARASAAINVEQFNEEIAQLAELHPGPEAQELAASIRARIAESIRARIAG